MPHAAACSSSTLSGDSRLPETIQFVGSNSCEYDPSVNVCSAPPVAPSNGAQATTASPPTLSSEPAVELLVSKHPPPGSARQCVAEKAALMVAGGALIRSAGAMVVTAPTALGEIPAITAFIASAIAVGASTALYLNCEDNAKAASKPK